MAMLTENKRYKTCSKTTDHVKFEPGLKGLS